MISKVIIGKSFYGCCRYVCSNEHRAKILEAVGVRDHNYKFMGHDFELNRQQLPNKQKSVFHGILSFYPGENITDEKMLKISQEYLEKLGIRDTQYCITKHIDKEHLHIHIIANLVNNKGKGINDSWIGLRGKKISQELTKKYELIPAEEKKTAKTNLQALNNEDAIRYGIYQSIETILPTCSSMNELVKN